MDVSDNGNDVPEVGNNVDNNRNDITEVGNDIGDNGNEIREVGNDIDDNGYNTSIRILVKLIVSKESIRVICTHADNPLK